MSVNETIRSKDQIIRRVQKATEMDPPWAGIGFVLDIGSDELADQLRVAYPGGKNLRARKHMAVIDFLGMELEKMGTASESTHGSCPPLGTGDSYRDTRSQSQDVQVSQLHVSYPHSVVSQASPSVSSSLDSPRIKELPRHTLEKQHTPDALNDPGPNTGSGKGSEKAKMAPAVPVVTAQTFVFNATDGKPVQPRSKKTMSNQERQEYKKTRQRGACMKCRRTKAKCTHESGSLSPSYVTDFKRATKRSGSPVLDKDQVESTKALKTEKHMIVRRKSPDQSHSTETSANSLLANNSGNSISAVPVTNNEQWKGPGLDGYVQNQRHPFRDSLPQVTDPAWPFSLDTGLSATSPKYMEGDAHASGSSYQCTNPGNIPQEDYQFSFDSTLDFPWTPTNGHLGDSGPK